MTEVQFKMCEYYEGDVLALLNQLNKKLYYEGYLAEDEWRYHKAAFEAVIEHGTQAARQREQKRLVDKAISSLPTVPTTKFDEF